MRSSLYYHIKLISVLLTVFLIFANFSVSRAATLENANISEYAKPYIEKLTESIQFDYDDYTKPIKRDEFARLIYFSVKQMSDTMNTKVILNDVKPLFTDTDDVCIGALSNAGIITGRNDECFSPNDFLTREEAAAVIGRAFDLFGFKRLNKITNFADKSNISPWAVSAVDSLCPYKIIIGTDNGNFLPKSTITREQAAIITQRFMRMTELFEVDEPLPDGYSAWQTWSASYVEDNKGKVIFSLPRYFPPEMGKSVESYDGIRICKYKDSYIYITSGIDAISAAQGSTIPGTAVFDILSGNELMFVPMQQNDIGNWASGFYDFTADGEYLIFYHQTHKGSIMSDGGKYVYGIYDINGNEILSVSHLWQALYSAGWVSEETEPFIK
ncbi:MAG: S-layer homology domain-containing protein [Eubacteriales bacterium]|nr:S-layer homology domain-containing protein [Eubacteriales bacterium]